MQREACLPHRLPMLLLSGLTRVDDFEIEAIAEIAVENIFVDEQGCLAQAALVELMAQTFAAGLGQKHGVRAGYLVALNKICFYGQAKVGNSLRILAREQTRLGNILVASGQVMRDNICLCSGEFKVWLVE